MNYRKNVKLYLMHFTNPYAFVVVDYYTKAFPFLISFSIFLLMNQYNPALVRAAHHIEEELSWYIVSFKFHDVTI